MQYHVATFFLLVALLSPSLLAQELSEQRLIRETGEEYGSMAFSPDGKKLYTAGSGDVIKIRDVDRGKTLSIIQETSERYTFALQVSPAGTILASGSGTSGNEKGIIELWKLPSGKPIATLKGHKRTVRSLAFVSGTELLVSGSDDKTINLWDIRAKKNIATIQSESSIFAISPNGKYVATLGPGQSVELRSVSSRELISTFGGSASRIRTLQFSPDGRYLASGGGWKDPTIRLWDVNTGENILVFSSVQDPVESVDFSPDGKLLASSKLNGYVELWDVATGNRVDKRSGGIAGSVAFNSSGDLLAQVHGISDAGSGVYFWRVIQHEGGE